MKKTWKGNSRYNIVKYEKKYYQSYADLFRIAYQKTEPLGSTNHRISDSPFGTPIIYLMIYDKKVVGAHSIYPIMFRLRKKSMLCGLTTMTMTHPGHKKKGIFTALAQKTHLDAINRKFGFVYGFGNENSLPGYTKKLGHKELRHINHIKIKKISFESTKISKVKEHYFPRNLNSLGKKDNTIVKFPVKTERSEKFISWRYKKNPHYRYFTSYEPDKFFFIFKKYFDSFHIIDFLISEEKLFKTLLVTAFDTAKKLCCKEVTMWIPKKHPLINFIKENSIIYITPPQSLHVKILDRSLESLVSNFDNWHYTMGDSDIF